MRRVRPRAGAAAAFLVSALLYGAVLLDVLHRGALRRFDLRVLAATPQVDDNWQTHAASVVASAGAWQIQAGLLLTGAVLAAAARRTFTPVVRAAAALVLVGAAVGATKQLVHRPSPWTDRLDLQPVGGAFPSGHVAGAVALGVLLPLLLTDRRLVRAVLLSGGMAWVALVGWSRVQIYVHWLSDVVGGLLVGVAAVAATYALQRLEQQNGTFQ